MTAWPAPISLDRAWATREDTSYGSPLKTSLGIRLASYYMPTSLSEGPIYGEACSADWDGEEADHRNGHLVAGSSLSCESTSLQLEFVDSKGGTKEQLSRVGI